MSPASFRVLPLVVGGALAVCAAAIVFVAPVTSMGTAGRRGVADTLPPLDPIARLQVQLDAGTRTLRHDSLHGYLPALLEALAIPVSSQGLVFSRTSLQTDKITPWTPRALYYNDDVYIGFVQESRFLEIASMHPTRGAVFYTLSQEPRGRLAFSRETTTCLMCHQSRSATGGVPGLMVLSTIADRFGYPVVGVHEGTTTDATPVRQRFGGWYVTGSHGDSANGGHSGNVYSPKLGHEITDKQDYRTRIDLTKESRRTEVSDKFDPSPYLSAHSDLVAMMVLVHQTTTHNLMTSVHEAGDGPQRAGAVSRLVKALLFADEAPLRGVMRGTTAFAQEFAQRGPRDSRGHSLRDFDLTTRLFTHPVSFLIYSDGFRALPPAVRTDIYQQIDAALADSTSAPGARLSEALRDATRNILRETIAEYPRGR
ncbi:MAG: hypothetical protein IT353_24640 [Gemmatimonadaceae bacterium]|nr:hypothetical protein [Gemmatimonadaceae bacterium]